ncbi:MAG: hypothetical protein P8174_00150 [Gemmatimonadota bacterium]|jgi:hypothetical protein
MSRPTAADVPQTRSERLHPAAQWALETGFDPAQVDCTTAVVLKILDGKCKMLPGEQAAVMAIYDAVRQRPARLFDNGTHRTIDMARARPDRTVGATVHKLRIHAEASIPKPVMKAFKAMLRQGLFG